MNVEGPSRKRKRARTGLLAWFVFVALVAGARMGRAEEVSDAGSENISRHPLPTLPCDAGVAMASPGASIDQPDTDLPRETPIENSLGRMRSTNSAIGGYGELILNAPSNGPSVVDLRRVVLYVGHDFTESIRFYSELEVEHAVSTLGNAAEVGIEQAYLDWVQSGHFGLRGGLLLMPMGIINTYHEPPSFFGVDRPDVDTYVIPTTWREPGVGLFGEVSEGLRYQLYLVDGFNANGFSAQFGVQPGSQLGSLAYAGDFGVIGRVEYEPGSGRCWACRPTAGRRATR